MLQNPVEAIKISKILYKSAPLIPLIVHLPPDAYIL